MRIVGEAGLAVGADGGVSGAGPNKAVESRPIDLDYLARQTLEDADLQAEVLALFSQQAAFVGSTIMAADHEERRRLAHGLRGSAGGIGAFTIALCAAELEHDPADVGIVQRLTSLIDEALVFIKQISR